MASADSRRKAARDVKERAKAFHPAGPEECLILGCRRLTARSMGKGLSGNYCRTHQGRIRRHGHPTYASYKAAELTPFRKAARHWLADHRAAPRVMGALGKLGSLMAAAGRPLRADYHAAAVPQEKARSIFARLHHAGKPAHALLEIAMAVQARSLADGPRGWPDWVPVQIGKAVKRLKGVSGTHPWKHGVSLPSRYPRSEGRYIRVVGHKIMERAAMVMDEDVLREVVQMAKAGGTP